LRIGGGVTATAVVLCMAACAPEAESSPIGAQAGGDGIIIVREKRHEHPDQFLAAVKEIQSRCFEAKAVVAQAQGWTYDPASERLSDTEIFQLDTERTAEYFEGKRYAKVVSGARMDVSRMEPIRGGSCKPVAVRFKSVEVDDGNCNVFRVQYDVAAKTGQREILKNVCAAPGAPPTQGGEPVPVPGTSSQCKWTPKVKLGAVVLPTPNECTLLPSPVHKGTGRPLVAIRMMPDHLRAAATPLPGMQATSMLGLVTIEQAVQISVGTRMPDGTFDMPADAASFPLAH
jgi:hypothetical protein